MTDAGASRMPTLESYLSVLDSHLGGLSVDERRDILMETRSHVSERVARFPFPKVEDVLEQLGAPHVYARQFLRDDRSSRMTGGGTALRGLAHLVSRGWWSVPLLLVVILVYTLSLSAFAIGVVKLISPNDVGVWVRDVDGQRLLVHAGFNAGRGGIESLGYKLAVIAFAVALVTGFAATAFLRRLARTDAGITHSE
ncbi:MAG TPA: hypothetical protein VK636_09715 [Gemmatimonadaceae bacterium]|nr:hypothetical protein [Gemmatimonadaceae bacterium]